MSDSINVSKFTRLLIELDSVKEISKKTLYFHTPDGKIYRYEATQNHENNFIIRLNDDMGDDFRE